MKIERTRNAVRNIVIGTILKVYQTIIPFLMRTVMIYCLGVEYLGLSSLFVSVLQVLNLAELGVGGAMVYCMYKPIAEDDTEMICALMRQYRIYYRIIGAVIAILGILLFPFIPNLISGNIPDSLNIYSLYLLNLATTVLSYWLFAYKNCLLNAHQRIDISSKILAITSTIQYALQFWVLFAIHSYYIYLIIALVAQIINNVITAAIVSKIYPKYKPLGKLDRDIVKTINSRIRDLFTSKIGGVIVNSADTVVISAFLGLTVLAIYQNYFYIITAIITFIAIIFNSCTAGVGNSIIVETKEKNYNDFKRFTFIITWISSVCVCCLLCLYQPFMTMWVGRDLLLNYNAVICLCVYFFVYEINQLFNLYKDASGIWHEDRLRPLVTALSNLVMNLVMVQFLGIYGVLLSTVISTVFIGMPWLLYNLFTTIFDKKQLKKYLRCLTLYIFVTLFVCGITVWLCNFIKFDLCITFIIRLIICLVISNGLLVLMYHKQPEFIESINLFDNITKGKLHLTKLFYK